jgi:hypothetical protein
MPIPGPGLLRQWLLATVVLCLGLPVGHAQGVVDPVLARRIEAVHVSIANPSADAALNARVDDFVRRTLGMYPSDRYSADAVRFALARARRSANIADITHSIDFGPTGGVIVTVEVTLGTAAAGAMRGVLGTGEWAEFPVLYDQDGRYVRAKVESVAMYYGNRDAWYGRPDLMLAGNPLVTGTPAGPGYHDWLEGFVHTGLYGIRPVKDWLYVYGGVSAIASGSSGEELFTDETRSYIGLEDAYVGVVGGTRGEKGGRLVFDLSAGRQKFSIGDGFLIVNSAANGSDRAALQSNPRWASDFLVIGSVRANNAKLQVFHFDPDELPQIDTHTRIEGVNLEYRAWGRYELGATFLTVPRSSFGYYTTTQSLTREGLQVYDLRLRWQPRPVEQAGPFLAGEAAWQRNTRFDMGAYGFFGEAGWSFADEPWSPTVSYRYAGFSGDDPGTTRFERWDPLFSGGNGEQWVQGINHFKVFQNSNLVAHRLQLRLRPSPKIEIVPQGWVFRASSTTNLGGNPALSFLGSKELGRELNVTGKYFASRRLLVQGSLAATFPGRAVDDALDQDSSAWYSTMLFVRFAF